MFIAGFSSWLKPLSSGNLKAWFNSYQDLCHSNWLGVEAVIRFAAVGSIIKQHLSFCFPATHTRFSFFVFFLQTATCFMKCVPSFKMHNSSGFYALPL